MKLQENWIGAIRLPLRIAARLPPPTREQTKIPSDGKWKRSTLMQIEPVSKLPGRTTTLRYPGQTRSTLVRVSSLCSTVSKALGYETIIVETSSRFARDLLVQEVGYRLLQDRGIDLIASDSPQSFLDTGPTSKLIRQVLGAVAEFEKAMIVSKLKGSRDRKRRMTGQKVEGRKSIAERQGGEAIVLEARRLYRKSPKTGRRRSLRQIADELVAHGATSSSGKALSPSVVKRMLER